MNGFVCLDRSVFIRCLRGDADLRARVYALDLVIMPSIALAELMVGALLSSRPIEEKLRVPALARDCRVVFPDAATVVQFAELKVILRQAGKPIPNHDIWIAALCLQHDWELAFRDKHFPFVPRLKCLPW